MRDYWLTQDLLKAAGFGFIALALLGIALALWLPRKWWQKGIALAVVLLLMISIPVRQGVKEVAQEQQAVDDYKERLARAKAMFEERCKISGEKIHKTAEGVDGIFLMKIRTSTNHGDQFKLDDPYGHDSTGEMYLLNFLRGFYHQHNQAPVAGSPPRVGYRYVEALDPKDGKRYRYTAGIKAVRKKDATAPGVQSELQRDPNYDLNIYEFALDKVPATGKSPRYGVTYDDISTHEEREYWIAGSSLKVVDLKTNGVIAERIGYMVDWGQGSRSGGRSPWLFAADNACPDFNRNNQERVPGPSFSAQAGQTIDFVEKVLKPSK